MEIKGKEYENASEGDHNAVFVDFVDLGMVETKFGKKHKIRGVFQVEETGKDGKRLVVMQRYTASVHEKSLLYKHVKGATGKPPGKKFDTESLIGVPCRIIVEHNESGDKVFANITAVMKAGAVKLEPNFQDYVRVQDRPNDGGAARESEQDAASDDGVPF